MSNVIDNLVYSPWLFKEEPIIIDAGARYGEFTKKILNENKNATVFAIEPEERAYQRLSLLKRQYDFELFQGILWNKRGYKTIYLWNNPQNSVFPIYPSEKMPPHRKIKYTSTMKAKCVTLAQLVKRYGWIDLLKMNIEGSEYPVLENVRKKTLSKIGQIAMEIHTGYKGKKYSVERMIACLDKKNFEAKKTKDFDWENHIIYARNRDL